MNRCKNALIKFGFTQSLKGALIIGVLAGTITGGQGIGYAITYPDAASRAGFAASLEGAPGLGVLYGESKNLASPAGYMVYRTVPFMGLIVSIWALMTLAKLLRGQEEDGRLEIIAAGATTTRSASGYLALGFGMSFLIAFAIGSALTVALGSAPEVGSTWQASIFTTLAIFLPAAFFGGIGLLVSQLSITKRRALLYGVGLLIGCFGLRAIANTMTDLYWLKQFTPFGWADRLDPVLNLQPAWFIPFLVAIPLVIAGGIYLAAKRDLGAGLLPESDTAKSRFILLGSVYQFSWRQHSFNFITWGVVALGICALMAAIADVAVQALADSPSLAGAFSQIGGSADDLKVAFLGTGLIFIVIILLVLAATSMTTIRASEAKTQLDTLLVQPVRRTLWLSSQLLTIIIAGLIVSLLCVLETWIIARAQGTTLDLNNLLLVGIALIGTAVFTLGAGTLLYGIWPRVAAIGMYTILAWSFLIDIIASIVTLPDSIANSSLFHYLSLSPTSAPDWTTFAWLISLGILMAILGILGFTKRDLISE